MQVVKANSTDTDLAPVRTEIPAERHPAAVYLSSLGNGSRRAMAQALDTVADMLSGGRADAGTLPWAGVRYQHVQAVRTVLSERYAPATANKMLSALRGVLRESWRLGYMDAETYHRAVDVKQVKGETLPAGRELTNGELTALFKSCAADRSPAGARDAALLSVLYGAGLRRSELAALDLEDYNTETGELVVRHAKGSKQRIVYATNGGRRAVDAWIAVRGQEPGALFCPVLKGGRVVVRRMTPQAVYDALRRRASKANVSLFSPHDCRRTFVSHLLDAGADIATVQHLAGHASVNTTARYDRRGETTKRKAAELLHVPYCT